MSVVEVAFLGGFSMRRKDTDPVSGPDVVGESFGWAVAFPPDVEDRAGCGVGEDALPGRVGRIPTPGGFPVMPGPAVAPDPADYPHPSANDGCQSRVGVNIRSIIPEKPYPARDSLLSGGESEFE
jgi:hypothetical protein